MTNTANQIDIEIGRNLKRVRHAQGLSQTNLAEKIGLTFQQIQKYEAGVNRIAASRLVEIAEVLKVDIQELLPALTKPRPLLDLTLTKQSRRLIGLFQSIPTAGLRETILRLVQEVASKPRSG